MIETLRKASDTLNFRVGFLILFFCGFFATGLLSAQTEGQADSQPEKSPAPSENEETVALDTIIITGTRSEKRLKDSPVITEVITEEEIKESGAQTVSDILADYGLMFASEEGHGDSVQIQGVGKAGVLFLIDGRRVIGKVVRNIEGAGLPVANVERVEIIRGPQSALYGSDAMGGVVNIITKKTGEKVAFRANAENTFRFPYDDPDTSYKKPASEFQWLGQQNLDTVIDLPLGDFKASLNLSGTRNGAYFDEENSTTILPSLLRAKAGLTTQSRLSDTVDLSTIYAFSIAQEDESDFLGNLERKDLLRSEASVETSFKPEELFSLNVRLYHQYYARQTSDYSLGLWSDLTNYDYEHLLNGDVLAGLVLSDNNILTLGFEATYNELHGSDLTTSDKRVFRDTQAIVVQDEFFEEDLYSIVVGVRAERNSQFGLWASPKVSAMLHLDPKLKLFAGVGMGYHAPDFNDLYVYISADTLNFDHPTILGNPDLQPEYNLAANLGFEFADKGFTARLNVFHQELFNEITYVDTGLFDGSEAIYKYQNVARSLRFGFDAETKAEILEPLFVSLAYGFVYAYDREAATQLYNQPSHTVRGQVGLNLKKEGLVAKLSARYFSPLLPSENLSAADKAKGEHRFTLDFYLSKSLGEASELYLRFDNILGYVNKTLGPFVPQEIDLGLRLSF